MVILFYDENVKFSREKKTGNFSDKFIHILGTWDSHVFLPV